MPLTTLSCSAQPHDPISRPDIVIESSRPRAFAQLAIDARAVTAAGATWLSVTGHGRTGDAGTRIGLGDDAAIAGGLGAAMRAAWGKPLFAGDAIADPLTGVTAALADWSVSRAGGGCVEAPPHANAVRGGRHSPKTTRRLSMNCERNPRAPVRRGRTTEAERMSDAVHFDQPRRDPPSCELTCAMPAERASRSKSAVRVTPSLVFITLQLLAIVL